MLTLFFQNNKVTLKQFVKYMLKVLYFAMVVPQIYRLTIHITNDSKRVWLT